MNIDQLNERNNKIQQMTQMKLSGLTYEMVGKFFGISRQRAHQLIGKGINPQPARRKKVKEEKVKIVKDNNYYWNLFLAHVTIKDDDSCWNYDSVDNFGYGRIHLKRNKTISARKFIWEKVNGPLPEGRKLHSTCGNNSCVNPYHLYYIQEITIENPIE
jgi:hypothetical protein